jgi:arylsulfatase A-like enzyme
MRPLFLAGLGVVAVAAAAVLLFLPRVAAPPNVLVLVLDTTRADRCSLHGYARPTTPRLDALARDSVVFDDAWSPSPWTFPAHASLFTGRSPRAAGVLVPSPEVLPSHVPTMAEEFRRAGWATGCFTCTSWIAPHAGLTRGFEQVAALYPMPPGGNAALAHERALAWMRAQKQGGRRFLAFVNDAEPHAPYSPPDELARRFVAPDLTEAVVAEARVLAPPRSTRISLGADTLAPEVLRAASDLYDAEIAALDAQVGRLLDGMEAEGLLDSTFVVIASDHGEGLLQHGWLEHGTHLHRELLHVVLMVRPPGGTAGRRVTVPVELQDVLPTLLEACALPLPSGVEGRSLLTDPTPRKPRAAEVPRVSFLEGFRSVLGERPLPDVVRRSRRSVYDGRHHLVVDDTGAVTLHDVSVDPLETVDVARERPDVVDALRALVD